ncbi:hypothetical protein D918_07463, partial [Trichuris suis]
LFRQLCDEKYEEYNRILLRTEVRWLSRGACLTRFYELFESVLSFLAHEDVALRDILELRQADLAYLADLYEKFNAMNLQLRLAELKRCPDPCDQDLKVYWEHPEMLHEDLKRRFHDVFSMVMPNWVLGPFASDGDAELTYRKNWWIFSQTMN